MKGSHTDMTDLAADLVAVPVLRAADDLPASVVFSPLASAELRPSRRQLACKRVLDIVLGTVLALAAVPVVAAFAVVSALTLRCSPFFVQWRHGHQGQRLR